MPRILITTVGSRGDVQPFVALGKTLVSNGHSVTLSTGQGFDTLTAGTGIKTAPLSVDMQALIETPEVQAALRTMKGKWQAFQSTKDIMRRQLEDIWQVATEAKPDAIIYNVKAFIAAYAARSTGAVAIPAFLQPAFSPTRAFANPLIQLPNHPLFNRASWSLLMPLMKLGYRASLGGFKKSRPDVDLKPPIDILSGYAPTGAPVPRLYAHSSNVVPKPDDWSPQDHVTGAWFTDAGQDWSPPPALAAFLEAGPPPIYIGFGSMPATEGEKLARTIVAALAKTGQRAIIARGWGSLDTIAASDTTHVLDAAPHDWLFPRCAAVTHHGGAGTTQEGLRWGRPTLVCPVFGDQPFWGRTVHELGAGPAPIARRRLTEDALADALKTLTSPAYASRAEAIGQAIRAETGTQTAATLIEGLLDTVS